MEASVKGSEERAESQAAECCRLEAALESTRAELVAAVQRATVAEASVASIRITEFETHARADDLANKIRQVTQEKVSVSPQAGGPNLPLISSFPLVSGTCRSGYYTIKSSGEALEEVPQCIPLHP